MSAPAATRVPDLVPSQSPGLSSGNVSVGTEAVAPGVAFANVEAAGSAGAVSAVATGSSALFSPTFSRGSSRRAVPIAPLGGVMAMSPTPPMPIPVAAPRAAVVGEFPRGKRRGLSGGPAGSSDKLTTEERMRQKRMLRNRESAARSRDKRRTRNVQLEADIARRKEDCAKCDALYAELSNLINVAKEVLANHQQPA